MPALQIRDLPEPIHRLLAEKARRQRRSLAQQAIVELTRMAEVDSRSRRVAAVAALRAALRERGPRDTALDPVDAVREDRER